MADTFVLDKLRNEITNNLRSLRSSLSEQGFKAEYDAYVRINQCIENEMRIMSESRYAPSRGSQPRRTYRTS